MNELFTRILNMSTTASILVLIVLFLRLIFKKAPKKYICLLWALVAIRLICPVGIQSPLSAFNILELKTDSIGQIEYFEYNHKSEKPAILFETPALLKDNTSPDSMTLGAKTSDVYLPPFVIIWITGLVIMFLYGSISYIFLKRKVRASLIEEDDIYIADEISSPFILGIINPIIYLPSGLENDIRENVLLHEKEHLRRKDHLWKPLGFILLSVYWFNPLLWLAYILLCRDIEGACDEAVITKMNKEEILSYSNALLTCATYRRMISACPLAFGETDVKGRVKGVLNYKKPAFWISGVAILTCLIVSVSLLTNPSAISLTKINNDIKEIKTASFKYDDQLIKIDDSEFERLIKVLDDIKLNKKTVSGNISDELSICINDEINIYIDELNKLISINDKENVYQVNNPDSIENLINFMLRVANSYTGANETDSGVICPAVMIKGTVYYNTGYKAYITCGTMDGYIESECPINMLPSKDNQSNFGKDIGYQVGPVEGTYVVDYLGSYQIFATAEVKKTYRPTFEVKTEPGTSRAEVVLTGWVYEIYENALGIENSNGRYIVSLNNLYVGPEYFNLTDEVEIHFDGNVAESWPMQISNVYGIVVKTVPMKEK